jgi:uncharacterized protein (TIRG00374 family)
MPPAPAAAVNRSLRKLLVVVLVLLVVGVLVYRSRGAITLEGFSWVRLGQAIREARLSLILLSVAAIYVGYALRALRWVRLSRYLGGAGFSSVFRSTVIGFTMIFLLGRAGEPIRPILIARKDRLPISSMFGIYAMERVFDTAATAVLAGLSLFLFPDMLSSGGANAAWVAHARTTGVVLLAGLLAAIAFLVYLRFHGAEAVNRRMAAWHTRAGWRARFAMIFGGFFEGLQAIRTVSDLLAAVAYSAVHWAVIACIYLWIAHAFGGQLGALSFPGAMLVLAFTMVGSTLQLPAVGGGSQAASFLAFNVILGVEKEPAAAAAIVLWLVTFAACSVAGVPLLIQEGWSMGELRRLARAEAEAEAAGTHVDAGGAPAKSGDSSR